MPTSTGTLRRYQRVGVLEFTLQNEKFSLGAFVEDGQPIVDLFVPFVDTTSGTETYPAGRYLDLHPTATGFYTIDFNRAYNPYCYYNPTYAYGEEKLCADAKTAGLDGMLVVDLPPEECESLRKPARAHGLALVTKTSLAVARCTSMPSPKARSSPGSAEMCAMMRSSICE